MAITAIPGLFPNVPEQNNANAATAQPAQPTANVATDTVQLTEAQRVYQLYNQGQPISQIAQALSLSVAEVNSYLNTSNSAA